MDEQFRARAARRERILIMLGVLVVVAACGFFAISNTYYDRCTASFDRAAQTVVNSYLDAVMKSDLNRVENCWVRANYFDLKAGCSELCLARAMGAQYTVKNVNVGAPVVVSGGRSNIQAAVSVACPNGQELNGEIILDSPAASIPWKHWRVAHSTVGGTSAQPWCK